MRNIFAVAIAVAISLSPLAEAQTTKAVKHNFDSFNNPEFELRFEKNRKRSLLAPLGSFFVPGLGQAIEGQNDWAANYGGAAIGSVVGSRLLGKNLEGKHFYEKAMISQLYLAAGFFSAYHDFRSGIRTYKDDYHFIKREDSIKDILMAPFDFSHLTDPRITAPLVFLGLTLFSNNSSVPQVQGSFPRRAAYAFGSSYMAGTGEEAFFRGYLLPAFNAEMGGNFWLANGLQAVIFGAAHTSDQNPFPIIQTLFGLYTGWLAKESGYSLKPGTFFHHWWDVICFSAMYLNPNGLQGPAKVDLINITF